MDTLLLQFAIVFFVTVAAGLLQSTASFGGAILMTLIFPPVSLKAKWFVLIFAAIELLTGISGAGTGIAHFAHLGGMLFGLVMLLYWKKKGKLGGGFFY